MRRGKARFRPGWVVIFTAFGVGLIIYSFLTLSEEKPSDNDALVADSAGIISAAERKKLLSALEQVRKRYKIDYRILTAPSISRHIGIWSAEQYAVRRLGKNGFRDRGLLVVVIKQPLSVRVEIGYALEPYIGNVEASDFVIAFFKRYKGENLGKAIVESTEGLIRHLKDRLDQMRDSLPVTGGDELAGKGA